MKTPRMIRRGRLAATTLLAGLLGASLPLHAGPHGGPGMFGDRLAKELALDDKQQALFDASRQSLKEGRAEGKALRQSLRAQVLSDDYDEAAVEQLADDMATRLRSQLIEQSRQFNALYRSLDADQRAKLAELERKRAEHRGKRWHREG